MKIWSDTLTTSKLMSAAIKAHALILDEDPGWGRKKARKRAYVWDIALSGDSPYRNGHDSSYPAATWDQWGIFLNALFEADPNMTTQYYASATDFHTITRFRFETLTYENAHRVHNWHWNGQSGSTCDCGAVRDYGTPASPREPTIREEVAAR